MTQPAHLSRNPPRQPTPAGQGQMPTRQSNRQRASKSQEAAESRPLPQKWYTDHNETREGIRLRISQQENVNL